MCAASPRSLTPSAVPMPKMVVTTLPYCDVQWAGLSVTTVIGPAWPPSRTSPRGKTVRTGSVVVAQSILRATSIAPPLSLAKIRVQASAYCAAPASERAATPVIAASEKKYLEIIATSPSAKIGRTRLGARDFLNRRTGACARTFRRRLTLLLHCDGLCSWQAGEVRHERRCDC